MAEQNQQNANQSQSQSQSGQGQQSQSQQPGQGGLGQLQSQGPDGQTQSPGGPGSQQQQFSGEGGGQQGGAGGSFAGQIQQHMEVVDADGNHQGTVDHLDGDRIKLTRKDSPDGHHSYVPLSTVDGVEDGKVRLRARGDNDFGQEAGS